MRRLIWSLIALVGTASLAAFVAFEVRNPESTTLDAAARRGMPGSFVTLGDGVTHYELSGPDTGQVVVLAHGASVPYYIWDSTAVALAAGGYRVLRYDYFGRGGSDRPDIPHVQALYVRQLAQLLDSLRIAGPIHLAGLSYGGAVITSFAAAHPDRVRSLVYVDPYIQSPGSLPWFAAVPGALEWYVAVFVAPTWASGQSADFLHPERWPDWRGKYEPQMAYKGFRHGRVRVRLDTYRDDQTAVLAEVGRHARPVLVIWGKQDRTVPFENSVPLMRAFPHATLLAVDSAGHLPHMEQAGIVQPAMIAFLKSVR